MVFNHGNKLCKASLFINNTNIENVKSYKYLGFTIVAKIAPSLIPWQT